MNHTTTVECILYCILFPVMTNLSKIQLRFKKKVFHCHIKSILKDGANINGNLMFKRVDQIKYFQIKYSEKFFERK